MVADDEIDTALVGVLYLFYSFDTAVEHYDQSEAVISSIIDAFI